MRAYLLAVFTLLMPAAAAQEAPSPCHTRPFEGHVIQVCMAPADADWTILNNGPDGAAYQSFADLEARFAAEGRRILWAGNAGMYHGDRAPVGLHVEAGQEIAPLVTTHGPGNFGWLPNGVVFVNADGRLDVLDTDTFAEQAGAPAHASQSGPMLVIDGALHPGFSPDQTSRSFRSGIGIARETGRVTFIRSGEPITFHRFARVFRDDYHVDDALFLDGSLAARLYIPGWTPDGQARAGGLGPVLVVTEPLE